MWKPRCMFTGFARRIRSACTKPILSIDPIVQGGGVYVECYINPIASLDYCTKTQLFLNDRIYAYNHTSDWANYLLRDRRLHRPLDISPNHCHPARLCPTLRVLVSLGAGAVPPLPSNPARCPWPRQVKYSAAILRLQRGHDCGRNSRHL